MRIISGNFAGRRILAPKGKGTRPTTDRFKETLFNIIENSLKISLKDKYVMDLFAGSGSLGIEALSRGAKSCCFVDKAKQSISAIENNLDNLGIISNCNLLNIDVNKLPKFRKNINEKIDIIFSDPPYKDFKINNIAIDCLISKGWAKDNTYLFLETSNNSLQKDISGFKIIEDRKIGESSLKIYLKTHY